MSAIVRVDSVSLAASGASLTVTLPAGRAIGLFGPAGSGKSHLFRILTKQEKPGQGSVKITGEIALGDRDGLSRRATPESIARKGAGHGGATRIAEALSATRLWDVRHSALSALSDSQLTSVGLLAPLSGQAKLIGIDGLLDSLDPWTFESVTALLGKRLTEGAALVLASNRAELARRVDTVVALNHDKIVFAGSYADLERRMPTSEVVVETHEQRGVRALVAPFEVSIAETEGGLRIQAAESQKIAAKLLTEGYGDIKATVLRRPTPDELLRSLLS